MLDSFALYLQLQWDKVYYFFNGDPFLMALVGTTVIGYGVFWILNALLIVIDLTGRPKWITQYKIQQNEKLQMSDLNKCLKRVIFNQIFISIPLGLPAYYLHQLRGGDVGRELPTLWRFVFDLAGCTLVEEIGFYYFHRLFHHPRFYKRIHKIHHEFTAPIGLVSMYSHPIEQVLANMLPALLGPVICGSHMLTTWVWFVLAIFSITVSHSGYHFPLFPSPEAHDFHHLKFVNCFGVMGILDRLHGTDDLFRNTKQYKRHFTSFSLTPLLKMIPD